MAKVKQHTVGEVRYFNYWLIFPGDKDFWCDSQPFVGDLREELKYTKWKNDPNKMNDLLKKGETRWKDRNGVEHLVKVQDTPVVRKWGVIRN